MESLNESGFTTASGKPFTLIPLKNVIDIFGNKEFGKNRNVFSGSYHQNIDGKPYFRKCLIYKSMAS